MDNDKIYRKAKKKVKAKKGFIYHLIAYSGVLGMMYMIMRAENDGDFLPVIMVALSWGIGLATHYFTTFGTQHLEFLGFNPNWEEEELENEIERLTYQKELKERIKNEKEYLEEEERLELREIEKRRLDQDYDRTS